MAIEKLKRHKSPGIDQNPAELLKARCRTIHSEIHKLTNSIWNMEELPEEWKESIILHLSIRRVMKQILVITETYHFCPLRQYFIQSPSVKVNSISRRNYWGSSVRF